MPMFRLLDRTLEDKRFGTEFLKYLMLYSHSKILHIETNEWGAVTRVAAISLINTPRLDAFITTTAVYHVTRRPALQL